MSEMLEENEHNGQRRRPMTNEKRLYLILYDICNICQTASMPRDCYLRKYMLKEKKSETIRAEGI